MQHYRKHTLYLDIPTTAPYCCHPHLVSNWCFHPGWILHDPIFCSHTKLVKSYAFHLLLVHIQHCVIIDLYSSLVWIYVWQDKTEAII
jgi:hypothetical protein